MDIVLHLLNDNDNNSRNDIKIYIVNMKSVIKSVEILENVVTVVTKSNVVRVYTLKSNKIAQQYYNDIVSWQLVIQLECE